MPVSSAIYGSLNQEQVKPLNQLEAMSNAYQLQSAKQGFEDDQAMRQAAMQSGGDVNKLYQSLLQGGNVKGAQAVQKQMLDTEKTRAEAAHLKSQSGKIDAETIDKALDTTRSFANQVDTPQAAASYIKGLYGHPVLGKIAESMMPVDQALAQIPADMNSPEGLRWKAAHVNITGKDLMGMLMPKTDSQNLGGNMSFGTIDQFSGKRTQTGLAPITETANNIANNETTRRGQNMVDARSREANQATREASQSVYDADRGLVINKGTGLARPAATMDGKPVSPKDKPLPEGAQKQIMGTRNLQDAIDGYQAVLANFGPMDMAKPDSRAKMGNAYNNMMLQAKEAYNLGVLNGPDYDILQSVVKDPTKLTSVMTSNKAMSEQADSLKNIAANIERTAMEAHGKAYTPRVNKGPVHAPATNAKGWALHTDAAGNKAYVSPDGKSFEEVK